MLYFQKYHGTGNDFIILNGLENTYTNLAKLAQKICHRNFGVGADGMMVVEKSLVADIKMVFYNSDGTTAPMCGNGIRCFAKYIYDNKIISQPIFNVETLAGIMKVILTIDKEKVKSVSINMGTPSYDLRKMDVKINAPEYIDGELIVENTIFKITILTLGTLHGVIFVDDIENINIDYYGKLIERHKLFPKRINVNFTQIINKNNIKVVTYERGAGRTLSCGTGASAVAVVSSKLKGTSENVKVHVPGGILTITQKDGNVLMDGPAEFICSGHFNFGGDKIEKN